MAFKFFSDEISRDVHLNSILRFDFSDEGDFPFATGIFRMSVVIDIPRISIIWHSYPNKILLTTFVMVFKICKPENKFFYAISTAYKIVLMA